MPHGAFVELLTYKNMVMRQITYNGKQDKSKVSHANCVISSIGSSNLHKEWTEGVCEFDLHLLIYDESLEENTLDTPFVSRQKGYKLKNVHKYLMDNPWILDKYDYFFIPDDDILMDPERINRLFHLMRQYKLRIAQPSLIHSYFLWGHTLHDPYCKLRYTNYVEMMVPCFSKEALQKVLFTFNENETGWGTEAHWASLINSSKTDMGIIDEISIVHTRPIQSGLQIHRKEAAEYLRKHHVVLNVEEYGYLPVQGTDFLIDRKTFWRLVNYIKSTLFKPSKYQSIGMDGYCGFLYSLILLSHLTQARLYEDKALEVLHTVGPVMERLKNNLSFQNGITGCCWLIEKLVADGILKEDADWILEDVDRFIDSYIESHSKELTLQEILGIGKYWFYKAECQGTTNYKRKFQGLLKSLIESLSHGDIDCELLLDAIKLLKACDMDTAPLMVRVWGLLANRRLSQVEHVHVLFQLYLLEEPNLRIAMKNKLNEISSVDLTLREILMLEEILVYNLKKE